MHILYYIHIPHTHIPFRTNSKIRNSFVIFSLGGDCHGDVLNMLSSPLLFTRVQRCRIFLQTFETSKTGNNF